MSSFCKYFLILAVAISASACGKGKKSGSDDVNGSGGNNTESALSVTAIVEVPANITSSHIESLDSGQKTETKYEPSSGRRVSCTASIDKAEFDYVVNGDTLTTDFENVKIDFKRISGESGKIFGEWLFKDEWLDEEEGARIKSTIFFHQKSILVKSVCSWRNPL